MARDYAWSPLNVRSRSRSRGGDDSDMPVYRPGQGQSKAGTSERDRPKPLGVPEGYMAPYTRGPEPQGTADSAAQRAKAGLGPGTIGKRGPSYFDGDQYRPASLDPASIGKLQASLAAAGLLEDFRYGVWDEASQDAYASLLGEANASGLSAEAALQRRAQGVSINQSGSGSGGGGSGHWEFDENGEPFFVEDPFVPPPLQVKTTNKDDLRRVFRSAVIEKLGQGWSQAQIDELVDSYNWKELAVQTDAYSQEVGRLEDEFYGRAPRSNQITSVSPPSPETFVETEMQRRDPVGFQAGQITQEFAPAFMNAIKGWV